MEFSFNKDIPSRDFSFANNGEILFTIKGDGTIVKGPAFTTDDAMSLQFWEMITYAFPIWRAPYQRVVKALKEARHHLTISCPTKVSRQIDDAIVEFEK